MIVTLAKSQKVTQKKTFISLLHESPLCLSLHFNEAWHSEGIGFSAFKAFLKEWYCCPCQNDQSFSSVLVYCNAH
jgi:hypothetical protein